MAQLSSPGVAVTVIDESFYTPSAPGTTPLIIIASAEGKQNGSATGTALGTVKANAGKVYLLTSQKDLADTFGTPVFKTDANNNPIHAGEQNEYGLQAAYSYLGVSNRAFVVRADIDTTQLDASAEPPAGEPENNTYWFETDATNYGIFQWNSDSQSVAGGQTFTVQYPTVITSASKLSLGAGSAPKASFGAPLDYAIDATTTAITLYFKNASNQWVEVGSSLWTKSWATVRGTASNPTLNAGSIVINGSTVNIGASAVLGDGVSAGLVKDINDAGIVGVTAAKVNGRLELYSTGSNIVISGSGTGITSVLYQLGLISQASQSGATLTFKAPALNIKPHTDVPNFKRTTEVYNNGNATGSIWVKTTTPNLGANWKVRYYNSASAAWVDSKAPLYADNATALAKLDPTGGGINLALNSLYVKFNDAEASPIMANFKLFYRNGVGATTLKTTSFLNGGGFAEDDVINFTISESLKGDTELSSPSLAITFTAMGDETDGETLAEKIGLAGLTNIIAEYDATSGIVTISHKLGGDFRITDNGATLDSIMAVGTTAHLYDDPSGDATYQVSLWSSTIAGVGFALATPSEPTTLPADGRLWYNSMIDEVDIMIHDGETWVGYSNFDQTAVGGPVTDPAGPFVRASKPTAADRTDGASELAHGDIWIDTSDLENFPKIYKFNYVTKKWVAVDNSDQTTEDGILFRDARWGTDGGTADAPTDSSIVELLSSDFLDFDAPDPALYPKGMLLWNLRRSGFNVKRFVRDYVDTTETNYRVGGAAGDPMTEYYPHRWVSEAGNQEDGSGTFGRKAQRKVVVQALQALVNSNQQIRDEESRVFNLIACPGYPELIGEMVSLNYDRGLTAFVVGDTPARLTPDATTLSNWGNNLAGALEDNDSGLVSFDEYLGCFYPWGFTSDNLGNNVVVPPSHMMLRTIALSDNVSYPWFAPAGTRRGGITNATAVGYITSEGEFQSVALNNGQRDTLASVKVNPLTFITGTGLVNYGQYTRAKNASSLDRINVARLVIYLRRQFAQLAKPYVFEPNDKITRDEIKQAAESLLLELVGQRALYDYLVVCDESNNTPSRIDRSELYLDVAIEPVKAVEFIYIPLRLKNTGEIKGLGK